MKIPWIVRASMVMLAVGAAQGQTIPGDGGKFAFDGEGERGFTQVSPGDTYSAARAYGYDLGSPVKGRPWFFSVKAAPGEYRVTVTLGGPQESVTTVKAETRRLMLEAVHADAGETVTRIFLTHVRVPEIPGGRSVSLKPREKEPILFIQWNDQTQITFKELDWDEKLTLEFSGTHPSVRTVEVTPIPHQTTIYLAGDSTMTDQMMEPWAAWGQMLPRWINDKAVVANYAESGETAASFISEKRWPKLLSEAQPGDYVLMQFGINDQRGGVERFTAALTKMVDEATAKGLLPVLVTSQNLERLDADGKAMDTLGDFPQAMRDLAKEKHVGLIDLNAMSERLYTALGREKLKRFFVDGTHQTDYGAYELAKCVVSAMERLPLKSYVSDEWKGFDPGKPDPLDDFRLPMDPQLDPARPGGPGAPNGQGAMAAPRNVRRPATKPATTKP